MKRNKEFRVGFTVTKTFREGMRVVLNQQPLKESIDMCGDTIVSGKSCLEYLDNNIDGRETDP